MSRSSSQRLGSLDVLRGATIAAMVLVNSPGAQEDSYLPLRHAQWNGWTFADTIFPCFLFVVGVSLTLSTAAREERGEDRRALVSHAVRRSLLLYACGVLIDVLLLPRRGFPYFGFRDHLQLTGVLQKIAFCYLAAFLVHLWSGWRGVVAGIVVLNLAYLALLFLYPVPGCGAGVLTPTCSFPAYVNEALLKGYTWGDAYDPDGPGAVLPAITSVLIGVAVGGFLRVGALTGWRLAALLAGGAGLAGAGVALTPWLPINKPLWTPSYVLLMAGLATMCFAGCYWVVDVLKVRRWFLPMEIFGVNAVAAYLVSRPAANVLRVHVLGRTLYDDVCKRLASPPAASLLFSTVVVAAVYGVVAFMYRRRWFLKF